MEKNISCEYGNNSTKLIEFHLMPLFSSATKQFVLSIGVLLMYLLTMIGNLIITSLVCLESQLHTPMYFFLCNLSVQDIVYVSTILPKLFTMTSVGDTSISLSGCITQIFMFAFCLGTEFLLLTSMAYDRYIAICIPLRYSLIMNKGVCSLLATTSWTVGALNSLLFSVFMANLSFCNVQEINHFFCDAQTMLQLSYNDSWHIRILILVQGIVLGCLPFTLIFTSYMYIITTILKIRTSAGRLKVFSSCSSHLMVVIMFYATSLSINMKPPKYEHSQELDKLFSLLYIAVVPMLNPLVYSLRNKDVLKAMKKIVKSLLNI